MASSNRHWPSMYRANLACNIQQPQPHMNNDVVGGKSSLMSSRCDEQGRNPEPRPRWNPRPEQIRILEGIFNSGTVNPPRDEIRRIRIQLSEYGPVADANVFYWFQNRKSRARHKLRAAAGQPSGSARAVLFRACAASPPPPVTPPRHLVVPAPPVVAPASSSSSSSDRSSGSGSSESVMKPATTLASPAAGFLPAATALTDFLSTTRAVPALAPRQQLYYHSQIMAPTTTVLPTPPELITSPEPLLLQWQQSHQYLPATELGGLFAGAHAPVVVSPSPNVLLGLSNEESSSLGQDRVNTTSSSTNKEGLGHHGQYWNDDGGVEELSTKTDDAVSVVIRDDEKARLGSLHYDFGVTSATPVAAGPVHAAADAITTAAMLPSAAAPAINNNNNADQLQALLDLGLIGRTAVPTATVVAVARDASTTCASTSMQFSVPAMPLDVKQFGEAAVLLRHPGEPVLVNESGITVEPLQQDALYYVLVTGDLLNTMYTG